MAACTAGDSGFTSVTTTLPPRCWATARWNARTSGTRREPAVMSTLSDMFGPLVMRVQVGGLERRAGIDVAAEPLANQLTLAVGAESVGRPQGDEIGGRDHVTGRQPAPRRRARAGWNRCCPSPPAGTP